MKIHDFIPLSPACTVIRDNLFFSIVLINLLPLFARFGDRFFSSRQSGCKELNLECDTCSQCCGHYRCDPSFLLLRVKLPFTPVYFLAYSFISMESGSSSCRHSGGNLRGGWQMLHEADSEIETYATLEIKCRCNSQTRVATFAL